MFGQTIFRLGPEPFRELFNLQRDLNRIFSNMGNVAAVAEYPAMNIWSGDDSVIVTAELSGIEPDKLDIAVSNDVLTLSGSREAEPLNDGQVYHRQERSQGRFSRTTKLPFRVNAENVEASYKKGILKIVLHRAVEESPKKIAIKAA